MTVTKTYLQKLLPHCITNYITAIPQLAGCQQEWPFFVAKVANLSIQVYSEDSNRNKLLWLSEPDELSKAVRLGKVGTGNSNQLIYVEQSFLKYNQILSPQRMLLKEDTLKRLNFLYFNISTSELGQESKRVGNEIQDTYYRDIDSVSNQTTSSIESNTSSVSASESDAEIDEEPDRRRQELQFRAVQEHKKTPFNVREQGIKLLIKREKKLQVFSNSLK